MNDKNHAEIRDKKMEMKLFPEAPVLVVDDEKHFLNSMDFKLHSNGMTNVECCQDSLEVLPRLKMRKYSLILLDMVMPGLSGDELLLKIVDLYPQIPVIVVTGYPESKTAEDCMQKGASDYLAKPVDTNDLIRTIRNALELKDHQQVIRMKKDLFSGDRHQQFKNIPGIITGDDQMEAIFRTIGMIAATSKPVLIRGETGVGKELIARAIHQFSRREGEFVAANIGGLDDNLFSDTLFGHEKGAFTGATQSRKGLIEQAKNGTIFLDEIGDLSPESQVKLLRLIQEGKYYPLGVDIPKSTNARIVAATNKYLLNSIKAGEFRQDLYFRLETHDIYVPPLRKRKQDIPLLVDHFLEKFSKELNKKKPAVPGELFILLSNYHFSGNIRELESMVYDAVSRHEKGILSLKVFQEKIEKNTGQNGSAFNGGDDLSHKEKKVFFGDVLPTFAELEEIYLKEVMRRSNGNKSMAAKLSGLQRKTLAYRLQKLEKKRD
jgi:DNA-binding NtrC family response regulator